MTTTASVGDLVVIIGQKEIEVQTLRSQLRQLQAAVCTDPSAHAREEASEGEDSN